MATWCTMAYLYVEKKRCSCLECVIRFQDEGYKSRRKENRYGKAGKGSV